MAGKKNGKRTADNSRPKPTEDDIRIRAYEIYLSRNGSPGNETEDWLQAERELCSQTSLPPGD